ncbi:MAG TPA: nitroreductase family deazaflavin-dependent oxidoreductase [Candidatus Eisenbacteria bacterium]|nr:nitroreductase family deazaflavin-dependent oxidoreductase [Candidatus Eisenbacteria bacterium]
MSTDANAMSNFNRDLIEQFRANDGEIREGMFKGAPVLLLTTRGAKSGATHTTPLVYTRDGDRLVVIASKGGAPTNPAWYHNLVANPSTTVEVGRERFQARAVVTQGEERDRLFAAHAAVMPNFAEYQRRTTRRIPVIVLEPDGS